MATRVLILGASYGSLFGTKLLMAGQTVALVCTRSTAELINRDGTVVKFTVKGRDALLDVPSSKLPGTLSASAPEDVDPAAWDLVVLGMQEAQYGAPGVRELMARIARARIPCLAIMNMPPLPYLRRIAGIQTQAVQGCYTDPRVWEAFDPDLVTLASPDPQAFRPADQPKNVLQVGLPTNFKAARFTADEPTQLLRRLEAGIDEARFDAGDGPIEVPVKLKVHDSLFVPLAKWPMLITGNYRCILADRMIAIKEAVHGNVDRSREIYDWVVKLCTGLGADPEDLVPFDKYAKAAEGLGKPSSAARALFGGAANIERVDCLVRRVASQQGMTLDTLDEMVGLIDQRLASNRTSAP
ncbi:MAG TPA: hypothetical protein VHW23_01810 [Kofleriaceae bacterium]|jgi:hypothetical protein|nr:hypothetical protein [Kofleriaceae bacterium]